jgi:5-methylcytosine-specific restriction endonuclease McrA
MLDTFFCSSGFPRNNFQTTNKTGLILKFFIQPKSISLFQMRSRGLVRVQIHIAIIPKILSQKSMLNIVLEKEISMNLKNLSNQELHLQTKSRAEKERMATLEILWHLRENQKRMLFAEMGYRDLKEYCVKELKYSEGSAWRRISAMNLLKELPEMEQKIQSGDLTLTQISMAKAHFREVKATMPEKKEILLQIENQTQKATERLLAEKALPHTKERFLEIEKPKRGGNLEVTLVLDQELQSQLDEIQILLGKSLSKLELLKLMTKQTLEQLRKNANTVRKPQRKAQPLRSRNESNEPRPGEKKNRYVRIAVRRQVQARDQHRCQYKDPETNRQCESKFNLQFEHKKPFAKLGANTAENLQLLCVNHNRLRAVQEFGVQKMQRFLPSLN